MPVGLRSWETKISLRSIPTLHYLVSHKYTRLALSESSHVDCGVRLALVTLSKAAVTS